MGFRSGGGDEALEKRAPLENVNNDGQGVFLDNEYVEM